VELFVIPVLPVDTSKGVGLGVNAQETQIDSSVGYRKKNSTLRDIPYIIRKCARVHIFGDKSIKSK
jgi:hypothetical protein